MAVISLTSIPPRFDLLQKTVASLVALKGDVQEIRVNIPKSYRRFPEGSFSMPELPEGVTLVVPDQDLGPATKVLPTIEAFRGTSQPIIYCDDDRIVHPEFARNLMTAAAAHPDCIIANSGWDLELLGLSVQRPDGEVRAKRLKSLFDLPYRARRLKQDIRRMMGDKNPLKPQRTWNFWRPGFLDVMEGAGGVLLRANQLPDQTFDVPARVWTVDDIWLSGMAALGGVKIHSNNGFIPDEIRGAEVDALCNQTIEGLNRAEANLECVRVLQRDFGVWQEL